MVAVADSATLELRDLLQSTFQDEVREVSLPQGDAAAVGRAEALRRVVDFCRSDARLAFDFLVDITAVDYLGRKPRFDVVYHLLSLGARWRLRLKVRLEDGR